MPHRAPARCGLGLAVVCSILGCAAWAGCAMYHVGNQGLYACDVRTVYVPIFESDSFRRNLGERLTEAVIKEIEAKTPFKVVGSADADSVLSGRIVSDLKGVQIEAPTDEGRAILLSLVVEVSWIDRRGNLIRQTQPIPIPPELATVSQNAVFVPEIGQSVATGQQVAIQRMAEQIVGLMEAPW